MAWIHFFNRKAWAVAGTLRPAVFNVASLIILCAVHLTSGSVFVTRLGGVAKMRGLLREKAVKWHAACVAALAALHTAGRLTCMPNPHDNRQLPQLTRFVPCRLDMGTLPPWHEKAGG